jgi:hypothetical protein
MFIFPEKQSELTDEPFQRVSLRAAVPDPSESFVGSP